MSAIESLSKSAANNHGITLQPMQVKEIMDTLASYQQAYMGAEYRLESLMYLAQVMLERHGGKVTLQSHELDDARDSAGFDVNWDEETDVITIELSRVAVPEVPTPGDAAEVGGPGLALVPEQPEDVADGVAEDATEEV